MPNFAQISAAFRNGITNNPSQAPLLRDLRKLFRELNDNIADLTEATRYVAQTAPAEVDKGLFGQALSYILPALTTMPAGPGAGSVRNFRNQIRAFLVDVASPPWLKLLCESVKRTQLLDTTPDVNAPGGVRSVYDQQVGDPINALTDAAIVVLAAATSTAEELSSAAAVTERWRALTPAQPPPVPAPRP